MSKQSRQERREEREREARERYERNQAERNLTSSSQPVYDSREPDWTTGQGIGFLVALPGWLVVGLAALVAVADPIGREVWVLTAVVGFLVALPGTIVFNKCKRR